MGVKKKPEGWYEFQWQCELHDFYLSNLMSNSESHACKRIGCDGKERSYGDYLKCRWNVCPRLTKQT